MNDISELPRWAQDRIAELEKELRRWQDLYVDLAKGRDPNSSLPRPTSRSSLPGRIPLPSLISLRECTPT